VVAGLPASQVEFCERSIISNRADVRRPESFYVQGVAVGTSLVKVPMPTNSALIAQFRKAKAMTAFTQGQLFQFKLDQTAVLLPTWRIASRSLSSKASPTPVISPSGFAPRPEASSHGGMLSLQASEQA